ncbi:MAG: hypothetical protein M1827_000117 [Pycnora praestabilis]|nr:MAG: hypothetical protein M1827_000117 [Pycnora praestabilis]
MSADSTSLTDATPKGESSENGGDAQHNVSSTFDPVTGSERNEKITERAGSSSGSLSDDQEAASCSGSAPLPEEDVPPLPNEAPPSDTKDDGWQPVWDQNAQAYYFYNSITRASQWTNPRVPDAPVLAPGVGSHDRVPERSAHEIETQPRERPHGGYDPTIHGDYDPTASYAQEAEPSDDGPSAAGDPNNPYGATGTFNRFTGKWQAATLTPENFNDENKSRRQMSAFFDVDAAANSHDGKSLKAERSGKKLSKQELKAFKEKRREKKEEKRRAWLRD